MNRSILSAAIVSLGLAATSHAGIVVNPSVSIDIPANSNGIYLNVVTGASSTILAGSIVDYDVNPHINSLTATNWSNRNPDGADSGTVASSATGPALALSFGELIGPTSTLDEFISPLTPAASFVSNAFYGFKFRMEGPGTDHFGWIMVSLPVPIVVNGTNSASPLGTILAYGYESTQNTAIAAGAGIPEPTTLAVLGAAAAFVLRRRRA